MWERTCKQMVGEEYLPTTLEHLEQAHGDGIFRASTIQPTKAAVQTYLVICVHDLSDSLGELEHLSTLIDK